MKQEGEKQETRIDIEPDEESSDPVTPVVENIPETIVAGSSAPVMFTLGSEHFSSTPQDAVSSFSPVRQRHKSENDIQSDEGRDYSEVFEMDLSDEGVREMHPLPDMPSESAELWQFDKGSLELPHAFSDTDLTPMAR